MALVKKVSLPTHLPEAQDGWEKPWEPAMQATMERLAAQGVVTLPTATGPRTPFEPLEVPGVSLSEYLRRERDEDH